MYVVKNDIPVLVNVYSEDVMYDLADDSLLILFNNNHLVNVKQDTIFTGIFLEYPEDILLEIESLEFFPIEFTLQKGFIMLHSNELFKLEKQPIATVSFRVLIEDKIIEFIPHYIIKNN